jgi:hypothetical protein
MDPRSLVCFCPWCALIYNVEGLSIGEIRCTSCTDHGGQLVVEVRRYQDVKAQPSMCERVADEAAKKFQEETILNAGLKAASSALPYPLPTRKGEACPVDQQLCQEGHCSSCAKPLQEGMMPEPAWFGPTHRRILEAVKTRPGLTLKEYAAELDRDYSYVGLIISTMLKAGFLVKRKVEGKPWPRYFIKEGGRNVNPAVINVALLGCPAVSFVGKAPHEEKRYDGYSICIPCLRCGRCQRGRQ